MDPGSELIEKLLLTTGLSCEDLLAKLQQYKTTKLKTSDDSSDSNKESSTFEHSDGTNNNSEISEAKCSSTSDSQTQNKNEASTSQERVNLNDVAASDNGESSTPDGSTETSKLAEPSLETCDNGNHEDCSEDKTGDDSVVEDKFKDENDVTNEKIAICSKSDDKKNEEERIILALENNNVKDNQNEERVGSLQDKESRVEEEKENTQKDPNVDPQNVSLEPAKIIEHNYSHSTDNSNLQKETSHSSMEDLQIPESCEPDSSQEPQSSNTDDLPKSEDNLRDVLRMQLSSLRNMKKSGGYLPDIKPTSLFFHNLKKKRKSCDVNSTTPASEDSSSKDDSELKVDGANNEDSIISVCENTDFVIVNVTGGIDLLTPENESTNVEKSTTATDSESEHTSLLNNINDNASDDSSFREDFDGILNKRKPPTFFKPSRYYGYSAPRDEPNKSAKLTVVKNISENFNQDPGVKKSVKNSEKSPFVSDSLEDFLSESAQLKISYPIPKLGAEEGIREVSEKSPFDHIVNKTPKLEQESVPKETPKEKPKLVKAKTLAEMRRQFEKMKAKEKRASDTPTRGRGRPPKEQNSSIKDIAAVFEDATNDSLDSSSSKQGRNSFIMYGNQKILLTSYVKDKCVGTIDPKLTKEVQERTPSPVKPTKTLTRKPSLLSSLAPKTPCRIKYKPGPLSKKAALQTSETKNQWTTEVKVLPKVFLEVVPEVGKPVDPKVAHLLPVFDDVVITEERTNFALSVLKPRNTNPEPTPFKFFVPYKNKQEKLLVRKPFKPVAHQEKSKHVDDDPDKEIAKIVDNLITYVETKEIEDTLIKYDDTVLERTETVNENKVKGKRKIKRKKLDLELRRLNCKVIDVATNESESTNCRKPYCTLGCVCKSLLCESVFSNHCQLVECMFGCKCPETNSTAAKTLSAHTVNHLDDKAKKNMAKVEREFTQTLIHTDNDAILVHNAKMRRSSKPPKKYTDYVADDSIFEQALPVYTGREVLKCKPCDIVLHKLDLNDVIPFCMQHNIYNCYCKGEIATEPPPPDVNVENIPKIRIVKKKEDQHKSWYNSCARIRKVFPQYMERNKSALYNDKLRSKNLVRKYKKKTVVEKPEVNVTISHDPEPEKKPNKRKQSFTIREDISEKEYALQRRKKKMKPDIVTPVVPVVSKLIMYRPIFDGEIRVPIKDNEEMLNMIGDQYTSLEYLRILPWAKLIESFRARKICIWSRDKVSSPLLCNSMGHFPPKHFMDIRKVTQKSEIIHWILDDSLPDDRPRDLMHLILTPRKIHFLIAGYCLKKNPQGAASTPDIDVDDSSLPPVLSPHIATDPLELSGSPLPSASPIRSEDEDSSTNETNEQLVPMASILKPTVTQSGSFKQHSLLIKKVLGSAESKTSTVLEKSNILHSDPLDVSDSCSTNKKESLVKSPTARWLTEKATILTSDPLDLSDSSTNKKKSPVKSPTARWLTEKPTILNSDPLDVSDSSTNKKKSPVKSPKARWITETPTILNSDVSDPSTDQKEPPVKSPASRWIPRSGPTLKTERKFVKLSSLRTYGTIVKRANSTTQHILNTQTSTAISNSNEKENSTVSVLDHSIDKQVPTENYTLVKRGKATIQHILNIQAPTTVPSSSEKENSTDDRAALLDHSNDKQAPKQSQPKKGSEDPLEITSMDSHLDTTSPEITRTQTPTDLPKSPSKSDAEKNRTTSKTAVIPSRTLKCTHKDMFSVSKTLVLTNKQFLPRKLYYDRDNKNVEMTVHLPPISANLRWRLIYFNSNFTYLMFLRANYSIKYTDLMDVVKMSSNIKSTIILRNKDFCEQYKHPLFGIFCVPEHQDRLFVGPYLTTEPHNIETLRYLQGRLIDTEIFNQMVGKKSSNKSPIWVSEVPPHPVRIPGNVLIDITDDEVKEITLVDLDSDSSEETVQESTNILLGPPFVEELTPEELKAKHNINRYIITNIPHLGYLGACQRDSRAIEVFWPDGNKGYRFPNVTFAKNLLTRYFSQIFCPIPKDFKINVIIMTNLDVQTNKPIDPDYFSQSGTYFCGEFGIYEKKFVPESLLKVYDLSIDSLLKWHQEAKEDEEAMIRIFGLFLMSNEELRKCPESHNILQWAISEIYILKKLSENYASEKSDLQSMIRKNSQKVKELRKTLRTSGVSNKTNESETIEIQDSDEDDQVQQEDRGPSFKKICMSGKIETGTVQNKNGERSVLKSNVLKTSGISLLKSNDPTGPNAASMKPIKISINNSKVVLKKNNLLITKIK